MKLKDLINENLWNERKFGEPLPTLEDTMKNHQLKEDEDNLTDKDKEKAKKLGLVWKGKGYGKDGQDGITHKNVDGKLVKVNHWSQLDKGDGQDSPVVKKDEPKKLTGKDFDRDSDDEPKSDKPPVKLKYTLELDTKGFEAAKQAFDKIETEIDLDSFEDGPEEYDKMMDALESLEGIKSLDQYEVLQNAIDDLQTNQDGDSAGYVYSILEPISNKQDPMSKRYLGKDIEKNDNLNSDKPQNEPYTDGEIETIVDKDVDEIKAMLYGKNPLAKYMSYKDDKHIQQHLDALDKVGNLSLGDEEFHKDELYSVLSQAQQNMEMGKIKQGERFSGDRTNLPKSKVGTKVKDGKIKSSGPQQFADDVKNMKGEFDLGGAKIKDGKMFDADGNQMDSDDIEDFYYQDAFDEEGNNVGIDIKKENYNPSDKYLKESVDLLQREFGQPLPTLKSVTEKHQKNVKEGPDDVRITKKELQMLIKIEGKFRERMFKIEQGFLRDPRPENRKLAKAIKKSYKDNVTKFMREVVGMLKRMK